MTRATSRSVQSVPGQPLSSVGSRVRTTKPLSSRSAVPSASKSLAKSPVGNPSLLQRVGTPRPAPARPLHVGPVFQDPSFVPRAPATHPASDAQAPRRIGKAQVDGQTSVNDRTVEAGDKSWIDEDDADESSNEALDQAVEKIQPEGSQASSSEGEDPDDEWGWGTKTLEAQAESLPFVAV